jgi:hypothetical protein
MSNRQRYEVIKRVPLPHDVVVRIIQYFACWTPAETIALKISEEFEIDLRPFQLYPYDPDRPVGKDLPEELINLHQEYRAKYRETIGDIPIANQVYRLHELQRMYDKATSEVNPNPNLALKAMEAAAKETGGVYRRLIQVEHTAANGAPLPTPTLVVQFTPAPAIPNPAQAFQIAAVKEAEAIGEIPEIIDVEAV